MATMAISGVICLTPVYKYRGWLFEYKPHCGAWPIRKDNGELFKRVGMKSKFWDALDSFLSLPREQQLELRVSGGCIRF